MTHSNFVHLRVHSAYSLLEGAIQVNDLATLCSGMKMPAAAITDTNNLFGALEFSEAAVKAGVQPIIGCQLKVQSNSTVLSTEHILDEPQISGPMVFLAKNDSGYRNLLKMLAHAYLETDNSNDPYIPLDIMEKYSKGLIALTGGALGPLGKVIAATQRPLAQTFLNKLQTVFDNRLYMEIQRHGTPEEKATEETFLNFAYELEIPIVATNEVYFAERNMYEAHDALICIAEGRYLSQQDRSHKTPDHYLKSADEMRSLFADLPEAIENTLVIAQRCAFMVEHVEPILPTYDSGTEQSEKQELKIQSKSGLNERLQSHVYTPGMSEAQRIKTAEPYRERLDYELSVINQMGFPGYFLIVANFIQWAKDRKIPVGPGRGSGAGSVVAWSLKITDLDPLRFGLLFERFLNPERISMPDFDVDFCQDRRDEVIRYVQNKYGRQRVAQIITFGKLQARAVLRDVGRVLEMPYGYIDKICKLVPNNPANPVNLSKAIASEPQLSQLISSDPDVRRLTDIAKKLEGLYRHASTHAAGVVIGDRHLEELIPLYRDPRSEMPVTGFNMKSVEAAGLVKFDFLGLKTLTVLATAERLIRDTGVDIDLTALSLSDEKTFKMISRGETAGVFQLESSGMIDVLKGMRPDTFEDIIAVVALYRPGPMDNIPSYIRRKHGEEDIDYLYPSLEPILKETFGIMIYQEQVMEIARVLSGYSLGNADILRRAMGKKIQSEMDQQRHNFVEGAVKRKIPEAKASEIFEQISRFAGYGFNKSHAAAYALIAYQTAYLKANHPIEFMAASMTLDINNTDKLNFFRQELQRLAIPILPPDINSSEVVFTVEQNNGTPSIRYALTAIKNVGTAAMNSLVAEREANGPYKDLLDFFDRLDTRTINKRQLENLTRAGGLDSLDKNRRKVHNAIEILMRHALVAQNDRESNQIGLFSEKAEPNMAIKIPETPDWEMMVRLNEEFEALGCYLSGHPLDAYKTRLNTLGVETVASAITRTEASAVKLAGTIISKKERTSAKGNRYAFIGLSDLSGMFEVTVFSEALVAARNFLEVGQSVYLKAVVQPEEDSVRFLANEFLPLDTAATLAVEHLRICINSNEAISRIRDILATEKSGNSRIRIHAQPANCDWEVDLELKEGYALSPEAHFALQNLTEVIRIETFEVR